MSLSAIIKEEVYNGLPDALKSEYKKQQDGTFLLDVAPVGDFALENVKGLKSALASERTAKEGLERQLKSFDGLDSEKAREALKKMEDLANGKADDKTKEQIEAIKRQLTEKHTGEMNTKNEEAKRLTSQIEKLLIEAEAVKAIGENKGNATLLLPHVKAATRIRKSDSGEFIVEVIGSDGNARISPATGSTAPMKISELIAEMKTSETFAPAFEGVGASGSGSAPSGKTTVGGTIKVTDKQAIEANLDKIASGELKVVA